MLLKCLAGGLGCKDLGVLIKVVGGKAQALKVKLKHLMTVESVLQQRMSVINLNHYMINSIQHLPI